jgi:hypothetical protein
MTLAVAPCSVCDRPVLQLDQNQIESTRYGIPGSCDVCGQLCCAACHCQCHCLADELCVWHDDDEADNDEEELEGALEECSRCLGWAHAECNQIEASCPYCGDMFRVGFEFTADCRRCGNRVCFDCLSISDADYMCCEDCIANWDFYSTSAERDSNLNR